MMNMTISRPEKFDEGMEGYFKMTDGTEVPFKWTSFSGHDEYYLEGYEDEIMTLWRIKEDDEELYKVDYNLTIFDKFCYEIRDIEYAVYFFNDTIIVDTLDDYKEV